MPSHIVHSVVQPGNACCPKREVMMIIERTTPVDGTGGGVDLFWPASQNTWTMTRARLLGGGCLRPSSMMPVMSSSATLPSIVTGVGVVTTKTSTWAAGPSSSMALGRGRSRSGSRTIAVAAANVPRDGSAPTRGNNNDSSPSLTARERA